MGVSNTLSEPALISMSDAAKILGISRTTAHDLVRKGQFPVTVVRVGSTWKVNREQLNNFVAGKAHQDGE